MNKYLPVKEFRIKNLELRIKILVSLILFFLFYILFTNTVNAQIVPPYGGGLRVGAGGQVPTPGATAPTNMPSGGSITPTVIPAYEPPVQPGTNVSAKVGDLYLSLSGFVSPFTTVTLITDNVILRSTISDEKGNFSISQVLIKTGFSHFCLKASDNKHLGESLTCINIAPAQDSVTIKDIFLPPTLGFFNNEVKDSEKALAYGYTMPGANVTLHVSPPAGRTGNGQTFTTKADKTGYYEFSLKLKAGKYSLYSTANYQSVESKDPSQNVTLHVLNWWEQFIRYLRELWDKFLKLLTSWGIGLLWITIPILILIIILIMKIWPSKFTWIVANPAVKFIFNLFKRKKHPLHHSWFVGF